MSDKIAAKKNVRQKSNKIEILVASIFTSGRRSNGLPGGLRFIDPVLNFGVGRPDLSFLGTLPVLEGDPNFGGLCAFDLGGKQVHLPHFNAMMLKVSSHLVLRRSVLQARDRDLPMK
jgi:hypothetical protein